MDQKQSDRKQLLKETGKVCMQISFKDMLDWFNTFKIFI